MEQCSIIAECVEVGVNGAIIISAAFKESGAAGAKMEQQILEHARRGKLRIIGPNCLGVMSPLTGLNATIAGAMARQWWLHQPERRPLHRSAGL